MQANNSIQAQATLNELFNALQVFSETGKTALFFLHNMPLTQEDRQIIRDTLGRGSISIKLEDTVEPVEWQESGITGIWFGVYYSNTGKPNVETYEICSYPQLVTAQPYDVKAALEKLNRLLVQQK